MNHTKTVILKSHKITKSYYHAGDLEGNNMQRLVTKGLTIFNNIKTCLVSNKPTNMKDEEIELHCTNFSRLCSLMDSVLSTLHSKRGKVVLHKII